MAVQRKLRIVEAHYDEVSGEVVGDLAHAHWRYALRGQALVGGAAPAPMRGHVSWVLKRTDGDAWRVPVHHASLEPPAPSVDAAAAPPVSWTPDDKP